MTQRQSADIHALVMLFEIYKHRKLNKYEKVKRRAPQNDSDPSNKSFFNSRKQPKYEKHMVEKLRISVDNPLWRVGEGGGGGVSIGQDGEG